MQKRAGESDLLPARFCTSAYQVDARNFFISRIFTGVNIDLFKKLAAPSVIEPAAHIFLLNAVLLLKVSAHKIVCQ